jgi:hypothetical protein
MKRLIMIVMLMFATISYADMTAETLNSAGFKDLNDIQKAEVLKVVADKVTAQKASEVSASDLNNPAKLNEWVNLGKNIGLAFGGAAHELGIAANDFVRTPVGLITMGLIVWHFMGSMLLHFFGSLMVMMVGFGFLNWHYRTQVKTDETYSPDKTNIFGNSRLLTRTEPAPSDEWKISYMVIGVFTIIASMIVAFSY